MKFKECLEKSNENDHLISVKGRYVNPVWLLNIFKDCTEDNFTEKSTVHCFGLIKAIKFDDWEIWNKEKHKDITNHWIYKSGELFVCMNMNEN